MAITGIALYAWALPLAVCVDTFACGVSCGIKRLKIPAASIFIISLFGGVGMGGSLFLSKIVEKALPPKYSSLIIGWFLILIGGVTILFEIAKSHIGHSGWSRHISIGDMSLILQIFIDPTAADTDSSMLLSPREAVSLAIPLSLDSVASGLAVGMLMSDRDKLIAALLTLMAGGASVLLGALIGRLINRSGKLRLSWLGGTIMLLLGISVLIEV